MIRPADQLEGMTLPNGWHVDSLIKPAPSATGGHFSTGYFATGPNGERGFVKAMDYTVAMNAPNFVDEMKRLLDSYAFERDICLKCQDSRINRVVHAIDHGFVPGSMGPATRVEFLIFERADGDVRAFLDRMAAFDVAFVFRTLHATAAALQQLHGANMAHQDLKPSNVLVFEADGTSKLGDLGRAWAKGIPAPHDDFAFAGDRGYAPLESLFGVALDEQAKRFGSDLYLLGGLTVFFFTRVNITALVTRHISPKFRAAGIATYAEALPYLEDAFSKALGEFEVSVPVFARKKLVEVVSQLCNPDYRRRGNPIGSSSAGRYSLSRYVSAFDLLRREADIYT